MSTLATNIEWGTLVNRIRKLQKAWDYWHPQRQLNPIFASTTMQQTAERFCERIAPKLHDAKVRKAEIERTHNAAQAKAGQGRMAQKAAAASAETSSR